MAAKISQKEIMQLLDKLYDQSIHEQRSVLRLKNWLITT